jgi:hypothetical protein
VARIVLPEGATDAGEDAQAADSSRGVEAV